MTKSLISGLKVLLADDSVTMHRAVSLALRKLSCELLLADNGSDAERIVREQSPDVVLLDWDLPEKSGIELCREIKGDASLKKTKVVLLLSSFEKMDDAELNSVPSDARLWKPFEANVLQTMIETLVRQDDDGASVTGPIEPTSPPRASVKGAFEETSPPPGTPPPPRGSNPNILAARSATLKLGGKDSGNSSPKIVSYSSTGAIKAPPATPPTPNKTVTPPSNPSAKRLSIDDLFKGNPKESPKEDLSKEMTSETFRPSAFSDEGGDGTRESDLNEVHAGGEDTNLAALGEEDQESFEAIHSTIDQARSQTFSNPQSSQSESALWGNHPNANTNTNTNSKINVPPLPSSSARETLALPKKSGSDFTSTGASRVKSSHHVWEEESAASPSSGSRTAVQPDEIRRIVSEELESKFRLWLKEEVEAQLARVLKELE